ncbi:MAG: Rrf2 family transcriptional regulator [Gemmataceae bacterium]|nr:Rrf2 family transcriptional regulator [Gemmataceae bacterium]
MKISAQEEYGVRCLLRLARAHGGAAPTIPEIAAAEQLSPAYAGKLLSLLKHAGFVEAQLGRTGGYRLTRPPEEIRLGEALLALGEPLFEGDYCEKHAGPEASGPCVHHDGCTLRGLWQALEGWLRGVLDQVSLRDLLTGELPIVQKLREGVPTNNRLHGLGRPARLPIG